MSPTLIIAGIQASLRAAQAGADLYKEHATDGEIFLPGVELPEGDDKDELRRFIRANDDLVMAHEEFAKVWDGHNKLISYRLHADLESAIGVMLQLKAKDALADGDSNPEVRDHEAQLRAGGLMVAQWRKGKRQPSKIARFAVTMVDVGLEFVGANPAILGLGSRGEGLVVAFAGKLEELIPDSVEEFGPKVDFADRMVGIFLRAGLATLSENTSVVIKDEDVGKLVSGVVKPIVDALPESADEQFQFRELADVLAGPGAEAAFKILAENTEAYLGRSFSDDKALGAVTAALFESVKTTAGTEDVLKVFTSQGLTHLYQAGLSVAVDRPELFVGTNQEPEDALFRDLLSGAAATLKDYPKFDGPLGASLAASVIKAVGANAASLLKLNPEDAWEKVAITSLEQIADGLQEVLAAEPAERAGAFKGFTESQIVEIGRVVLEQVAATPGMLGVERKELKNIVAGIAKTISQDDNLLLNAEQWKAVAASVAGQAAANPGRLFGLNDEDPMEGLGAKVIGSILSAASNHWSDQARDSAGGKPILFGQSLLDLMLTAVEDLGGDITGINATPAAVDELLATLLEKAEANPEKIGSRKITELFELFARQAIAEGTQPTDAEISTAIAA